MIDHTTVLTTRGSNASTHLLLGLCKALHASGCTLVAYDFSGTSYSARNEVTVRGDELAIKLFKASIGGWANS